MNQGRDEAHRVVREAMEKAGIVDGFYGGVMVDGKDVSAYNVGRPDVAEYSNVARYQRLLGMMEHLKWQIAAQADQITERE